MSHWRWRRSPAADLADSDYRADFDLYVQAITIRITAQFHFLVGRRDRSFRSVRSKIQPRFGWPAGILAAGVVSLWLRGPSCNVQLQTAIGRAKLSSLHRLKTAQRLAPMLKENIESVQGSIVAMPEVASSAGPQPLKTSVPSDLPKSPVVARRSGDHMLLFSFLTLEAVLAGIWIATRMTALDRPGRVMAEPPEPQ